MTVVLLVLVAALVVSPALPARARLQTVSEHADMTVALPRNVSAVGSALLGAALGAVIGGPLPATAAALIAFTAHRKWRQRRRARDDSRAASVLAAALEVLIAEL